MARGPLETTLGQLLVNRQLPHDLRDYNRTLDPKSSRQLIRTIAERYPEHYREIVKRMMDVGRDVSYTAGGQSFGLQHMRLTPSVRKSRERLNAQIERIMSNPRLSTRERNARIAEASAAEHATLTKEILSEASLAGNPLAEQVISGSRGGAAQLKRLIGGDLLYVDHRDNVIPFPVQRSFAEGLTPADYWASTYGARKGMIDVKVSTADVGYFGKVLGQLAHRLMVIADDDDDEDKPGVQKRVRGLPVPVDDPNNVGALLAHPVAEYARNTPLTPKILQDLQQQGVKQILVRSPTVGGPAAGGVYARDVGIRERGGLPPHGDMVGLAAMQALAEKLVQGALSSKHSGGVRGEARSVTGFQHVNQLVQVPKTFKGGATHAQADGKITDIIDAPTGGKYVFINGQQHFVPPGFDITVEKGADVEAGDLLSDGIPNPAELVKHKGIGEGRRQFINAFMDAYRAGGMKAHRRNIELLARGAIDHVELEEETDDHLPGDIVQYQQLEKTWEPRLGAQSRRVKDAVGQYLEAPVLHYTIGTQIKPSMVPVLQQFGINDIDVHPEPPPFKPHMVRAVDVIGYDPDWLVQFMGAKQKSNFLDSIQRGGTSDTQSTSFGPALARGIGFGTDWPKSVLRPPKT